MLKGRALRAGLLPASGRHRKPGAEVQVDLKISSGSGSETQERGYTVCV